MKNKIAFLKILEDFSLNILASMIITFVTSFLINPSLARLYSITDYGLILTLMSIASIFNASFGNTLNNVRLIEKKTDQDTDKLKNYNVLILSSGASGAVIVFLLSVFYYNVSLLISGLLALHTIFTISIAYYTVAYRLKLDFYKNLIFSLITAFFYFMGLIALRYIKIWPVVYLLGDIFAFIYILKSTTLLYEPFRLDNQLPIILKKYFTLITITLFSSALSFLDKLIIFPMLGAESVAIFSVASFFGKSLSVVMGPIANVLLSYYSNSNTPFLRKQYWLINLVNLIIALLFVLISIFIGPFLTKIIYPTIYSSAKEYLLLGNISAIISILAIMANPAVLKYCKIGWQLVITLTYGFIYILLSIFLIELYGILGFAISTIIANVYRLIFIYVVGHINIKKANEIN